MRLLIHCPSFFPAVGGVESVAWLLAREFAAQGNQVRVFTETPCNHAAHALPPGVTVVRSTSYRKLWHEVEWCESYLQMGLSLKGLYPLAFFRRSWIVSHHTWYTPSREPLNRLKRWLARFATNIYCSKAIAKELGIPGVVIGNPYDTSVFKLYPGIPKKKQSLAFVGRLVSDKGAGLLVEAVKRLDVAGIDCELTIVGDGPERATLTRMVANYALNDKVKFLGKLAPPQVAEVLAANQVLVVPSIWDEPFGVVALEAIGCGCVVVGSSGGGLAEAIGPCGLTYPNGNVEELTGCLHRLLVDQTLIVDLLRQSSSHLVPFQPASVASSYLNTIRDCRQPLDSPASTP